VRVTIYDELPAVTAARPPAFWHIVAWTGVVGHLNLSSLVNQCTITRIAHWTFTVVLATGFAIAGFCDWKKDSSIFHVLSPFKKKPLPLVGEQLFYPWRGVAFSARETRYTTSVVGFLCSGGAPAPVEQLYPLFSATP
jgi:hypothetical protein